MQGFSEKVCRVFRLKFLRVWRHRLIRYGRERRNCDSKEMNPPILKTFKKKNNNNDTVLVYDLERKKGIDAVASLS